MARENRNMFDQVADVMADWLESESDQIAESIGAGGSAPFAAVLTEQQKIDYYTSQLFNPDGTPNVQGRAEEMARLGSKQFTDVYRKIKQAHPELVVPSPPEGAMIQPSPFPPSIP